MDCVSVDESQRPSSADPPWAPSQSTSMLESAPSVIVETLQVLWDVSSFREGRQERRAKKPKSEWGHGDRNVGEWPDATMPR
ncbi:unnamed protein product [Parascedosporium putredinis]|uniref:Uncharacterized protein n=1 Tax=Parascedosporium putredinis TaxID=1442378 RepID=A0A9P1H0S0_9PEZI|nr:unnamed protein product [Parascedosporium putredinis]CAI7992003.1 unnamed protein product [Parascedosporium putredinis]